jgi:23S rRNA (guanosine2251-2'-O)-methyltransferase
LEKRSGIDALWIARGKGSPRVKEILRIAEARGIPVQYRNGPDLDHLLPGIVHQGIVALAEGFRYADLEEILEGASSAPGFGLIVAADHITDEGNLGALIRTSAFFGVHGFILPKDRSAAMSERVMKRSAGAHVHLPVARVVNLGRALDTLKGKGFWIIGAAGEAAESIYDFDWTRDLVLVLGREDKGLGRSIRDRCHQLVRVPGAGHVESLNVSVAAGAILSEVVRQTRGGA